MDWTDLVLGKLELYFNSLDKKEWEIFSSMSLAKDFTYFTDQCSTLNKEAFLKVMEEDDWQGEGYEITELSLMGPGKELAIATYRVQFHGNRGGRSFEFQAIETTVFAEIEGDWQILHTHTSNKM